MNWRKQLAAFVGKHLFLCVLAAVVIAYLLIARFTGTCTVCGAIQRAAGVAEVEAGKR